MWKRLERMLDRVRWVPKVAFISGCCYYTATDKIAYVESVNGPSMQPIINTDKKFDMSPNQPLNDFIFFLRPRVASLLNSIGSDRSRSLNGTSRTLLANNNNTASDVDTAIVKAAPIRRGDVISFVSPRNPRELYLKRVIGMPGDVVKTIRHRNKFILVPNGHLKVTTTKPRTTQMNLVPCRLHCSLAKRAS